MVRTPRTGGKGPHAQLAGTGVEERDPAHGWWERKSVQPLWRTVKRLLKKLKVEPPCNPATPLRGIYVKKMKTLIGESTCAPRSRRHHSRGRART